MPLQASDLLVVSKPCESPKVRLVCFPHSGGGPSAFSAWAEYFEPKGIEVVSIALPGRERRVEDALLTNWEVIVEVICAALVESGLADDVPFAFFGHSLGAILAYEVARRADAEWLKVRPRPVHFFASGHGAPSQARSGASRDGGPMHKLNDDDLAAAVRSFGVLPEDVATKSGLMSAVLPVLRADFQVYEEYAPPSDRSPLELCITALGGKSDSAFPPESLSSWSSETSLELQGPVLFTGGHFFIDTEGPAVLELVQEQLSASLANLPRSIAKGHFAFPEVCKKLMHEVVLENAAKFPDEVAILDNKVSITYKDLAEMVRLAGAKLQVDLLQNRRNQVVGILMAHEASYIIGMLAIWQARAAMIVLETHFPSEMLKEICETSDVAACVCSAKYLDFFAKLPSVPTLLLDGDWTTTMQAPEVSPVKHEVTMEDLAILMMTSGTTGKPKQIAGSHYFVHAGHVAKNQLMPYTDDDNSEAFNVMFVWEAIRPLLYGLTSRVMFDEAVLDPKLFVAFISKHRCSRVLTTPSLLSTILQHCGDEVGNKLSSMRTWYMCGEVLPMKIVKAFREALPLCKLMNDYSSWEAGDVGYQIVAPAPAYEPSRVFALAGQPAPGSVIAVVDPDTKKIVPKGTPGELYCGGSALSSGYFGQPDLTNERFVDSFTSEMAAAWSGKWYKSGDCARLIGNENPMLEIRGRIDFTVKIRGFKVGIPVVEGAIQGVDGVGLCCVVPIYESAAIVDGLLCFIKAEDGLSYDSLVHRVKQEAVQRIPRWMMPAYFRPMPRDCTAGGESRKLDRKKLANLYDLQALHAEQADAAAAAAVTAASAPAEPQETGVRGIVKSVWAKALNLDVNNLDLEENFFDLGGHSQLAAKIATELLDGYGLPITVLDIYANSSLGALFDFLDSQNSSKMDQATVMADLRGLPRGVRQRTEGVSIVGMAGRFPGADTVEAFWDNIKQGAVAATFLSKDFLRSKGVPEATIGHTDFVPVAYMINAPDKFDNFFFGIGRHEASLMDPQHRVFIEASWAALENAALSPKTGLNDTVVGVFAAAGIDGYLLHHLDGAPLKNGMDPQDIFLTEIGNEKDYIATRVSYLLDFTGPSMNVNSACSSALVAVAQGAASIAASQCDAAVCGASSITFPNLGYLYQDGLVSSVDGYVRPFDKGADGTVFGDACASFVLRRKEEAEGTLQWATMRGFAVSNDGGKKAGYAAPSSEGQSRAIMAAMQMMNEDPWSISYVECHATGTRVGDGIEIRGLVTSFEQVGGKKRQGDCAPIALGSIKGNIAHANCAAGVTGLAKTMMMMGAKQLPPTANFKMLNPKVNLTDTPFVINSELCSWTLDAGKPRRVGVSSFGIGGTNAHVIVELPAEAMEPEFVAPIVASGKRFHLFPISAKTPTALRSTTDSLVVGLRTQDTAAVSVDSVAYTLQNCRASLPLRKAIVVPGDGAEELPALMSAAETLLNEFPDIEELEEVGEAMKRPTVAFVFPGQGSQYFRMARGLYESVPLFRASADECCLLLQAPHLLGFDLRPKLFPAEPAGEEELEREFSKPTVTQPSLFVVEYSLATVFKAVGVTPVAAAGHSLGEYAAAVIGGLLSLPQAVEIVAARAKSTETLAEDGSMLSVSEWSTEELEAISRGDRPGLWLAAVNSPVHAVISGDTAAIEALDVELKAAGRKSAKLHVRKAFHSGLIAKAADTLKGLGLAQALVDKQQVVVPVASNLTGGWMSALSLQDGSYWTDHMRGTVYWRKNAEKLLTQWRPSIVLEVGPGSGLSVLTAKCVVKGAEAPVFIQGMRHPKATGTHDAEALLGAIGRMWEVGCSIDWDALHTKVLGSSRVPSAMRLPTYAFDKTSLWVNASRSVYVESTEDPAPAAYAAEATSIMVVAGVAPPSARAERMLLRFGDTRTHEPSIRAYCLPFASGSATVFAPWADGPGSADDAVEVVAIELPGRGGRSEEAIPADDGGDEAMLEMLCNAILSDLRGAHYVLVGFSMGGGLSVELALRLQAKGAQLPLALYIAGRKPPAVDPSAVGDLTLTKEELAHYAFAPPEVASTPEFMEHVVPLLRADLGVDNRTEKRLSAACLAGTAQLPASIGFEVFCGVTDDVAPWSAAPAWQRFVQAHVGLHYMPGGHEFMQEHRPLIHAAWRRDAIGRLVQRRSAELAVLAAQGFAAPGPAPAAALAFPGAAAASAPAGQDLPIYAVRWVPASAPTAEFTTAATGHFVDLSMDLSDEAFQAAVAALKGGAAVIAVCGQSIGLYSSEDEAATLASEVRQCWRYVELTQRLLEAGLSGRMLIVCPVAASGALVAGASKAVAMEAGELRVQRIFLPDSSFANGRITSTRLIELSFRYPHESDIWVEDASLRGRVYTQRVEPFAAPSEKLTCVPKTGLDGQSAIYILTGATGGLGSAVVSWLINVQGLAPEQLVLLRRQGSNALSGDLAKCRAIEVSRPDSSDALIESELKSLPTVTGVLHLAGVLDDGILSSMTEDRFTKVAQPKCGIFNALVRVANVLQWPVEWIIGFSSTSSLFGYAGQSNYCAANALLDQLSGFGASLPEGDRPPCRVLAVNWGPWGEAGMAKVGTKAYEQAIAEGDTPLPTATALKCLSAGLRLVGQVHPGAVQLCACDVDWQKSQWRDLPILEFVADRSEREAEASGGSSSSSSGASAVDNGSPEEKVEQFMVAHTKSGSGWKRICKKSLHQLGLDSLEVVQLRNQFNKKFGVNVPLSLLADPSKKLCDLAPMLAEHLTSA